MWISLRGFGFAASLMAAAMFSQAQAVVPALPGGSGKCPTCEEVLAKTIDQSLARERLRTDQGFLSLGEVARLKQLVASSFVDDGLDRAVEDQVQLQLDPQAWFAGDLKRLSARGDFFGFRLSKTGQLITSDGPVPAPRVDWFVRLLLDAKRQQELGLSSTKLFTYLQSQIKAKADREKELKDKLRMGEAQVARYYLQLFTEGLLGRLRFSDLRGAYADLEDQIRAQLRSDGPYFLEIVAIAKSGKLSASKIAELRTLLSSRSYGPTESPWYLRYLLDVAGEGYSGPVPRAAVLKHLRSELENMVVKELRTQEVQVNPAKTLDSAYQHCEMAGQAADSRSASRQYFCDELPIGSTQLGLNPVQANEAAQQTMAHPWYPICKDLKPGVYYKWFLAWCENARQIVTQAKTGSPEWRSGKKLFYSEYRFRDKVGNERMLPIAIDMDRVSRTGIAKVSTPFAGEVGDLRISNPLGHHFLTLHPREKSIFGESCSYFPGATLTGRQAQTDYTVFQKKLLFFTLRIGATLTINPGSFSYERIRFCGLEKIDPSAAESSKAIQLVGLEQPRFEGAAFRGMTLSTEVNGFGIFDGLVNSLLDLAAKIFTGKTVDALITAYIQDRYLDPSAEKLASGTYFSEAQLRDLMSRANRGQESLVSGIYLQDIYSASLLEGLLAPQMSSALSGGSSGDRARLLRNRAALLLAKPELESAK